MPRERELARAAMEGMTPLLLKFLYCQHAMMDAPWLERAHAAARSSSVGDADRAWMLGQLQLAGGV